MVRILPFFEPTPRGQFWYPEHGQKQTFWHPPPSSCPHIYWMAPNVNYVRPLFCQLNQWTFSILRTLEIFRFGDGLEQNCFPSVGWTLFWTLFSLVFWSTVVRTDLLWDKLTFELNVVYGCPLQTIFVALEHPIESNRTLLEINKNNAKKFQKLSRWQHWNELKTVQNHPPSKKYLVSLE